MLPVGSLEALLPGYRLATPWVHYTTSSNTQSSAPEDGRDHRPKHVELIGIINKPLLLHLVGVYIIYVSDAQSNKYQILLWLKAACISILTFIFNDIISHKVYRCRFCPL